MTDVEATAEAPAQESIVEPTKPEAAEVVEIKLTTYNLKKAGQAPVSITPESKDLKLEPGDQLIRIYKGKLIEVDVLDSGYKWNGELYPTLTHTSAEEPLATKSEATTSSDFLLNAGVVYIEKSASLGHLGTAKNRTKNGLTSGGIE